MKDHPQTQPDPVEPEKGPESASQIASARTIADDPGSDSEITCRGEDIARFRDALEIGRGGMGAIYDVYDPDLDRRTALKMQLRPASGEDDSLGRFVREARITGWLEHPNIVPVHELGRTEEGGFFFSMKKVGGQSLAQHLFESASLEGVDWKREQRKLLRDFLKICDAVSFAHSRGVVHRDLKPENVMLGDFGEVLVMDWGLAKIVGKEDPFSDSLTENADIEFEEMGAGGVRTQEGIVVGTPMYMAPEQAWGCHDEIDGRTDIYSLGAMLYEIVTRSRPYLENSAQEILVRLRRGIVDHPRKRSPELSGELAAIVSRAMAFEAEDRYATVDGLRDDILHYLEGGWVEAARYSVIERLTKWIRRHRVGVGIGAAVVLSAATVLVGTRMVRGAHRKALLEGLVSQAVRGAAELSARVEAHQVTLGKRSADGELGLENREKSESLLAELQERVELWSKAYRLDPQNQRLRLEVHRNYLDLGRFAQQSEAFTLARFAFREAGALSEDPQEWERNLAGLQRARGARLGRHRKRILSVLDTVRTGKGAWTRKGDQPLVLELASFRERQTVDLLLGEMEALTTRLRKVTEESFLNINELSEKEIEIGWKPIVGLEEVVRKWMRAERPLADEKALALFVDPSVRAVFHRAWERIELRDERKKKRLYVARDDPRGRRQTWREILASRQRKALLRGGENGVRVLGLVIESLELLGPTEQGVESLGDYLWAEWDESRAIPAGLVLARWGEQVPKAHTVLLELVGRKPGQKRPYHFDIGGLWGRKVFVSMPGNSARSGEEGGALPASPEEFLKRARTHQALGRRSRAEADCSEALRLDPRSQAALILRGNIRLQRKGFSEALEDFDRALRLDPKSWEAWYFRGLVFISLGKLSQARKSLDRALRYQAENPNIYLALGGVLGRMGEWKRALEVSRKAVDLDARMVEGIVQQGLALDHLGRSEEALQAYGRALAINARSTTAYHGRGTIYLKKGASDQAIEEFTRALEIDAESVGSYTNRSLAYRHKGEIEKSLADLDRALEIDPLHVSARTNRGVLRRAMGNWQGAIDDYNQILSVRPRDAQTFFNRGRAWVEGRDWKRARQDFNRVLEIDPKRLDALVCRGSVSMQEGRWKEARADLDRVIEIDPDHVIAYRNRGDLRQRTGDLSGAVSDFTESIRIEPSNPEGYVSRGDLLSRTGEPQASIADFDRALSLDPRNQAATKCRAMARMMLKQYEGAMKDLIRALELDPEDHESWGFYGWILAQQGKRGQALQALQRAAQFAPPPFKARYQKMIEQTR